MEHSAGEMPFLDHLEELRGRIIRALLAVFVGVGVGLFLVSKYNVVGLLKVPIAPYLPGGKLTILAPTEQVMIVLKLGVVIGLVLASPVIVYQLWAFLSPALYEREKKAMMPALAAGLVLFLFGGWLGWIYGVPMSLKFLMTISQDDFVNQITFGAYFSFVIQVILAVGISFELPLVMTMLSWIGVMDAKRFSSFRRYAILLNCIAGAILSPGTDVLSMIVCSLLLIMLYELGVVGAFVVQKRRRKAAEVVGAIVLLCLLAGGPRELHAQNPRPRPVAGNPSQQGRGTPGQPPRAVDSSTAKRLGIPSGPRRKFSEPDSVMQALLTREGFAVTRFIGDSATLLPGGEGLFLGGRAATRRDTSTLEADQIQYNDARCEVLARGEPRMFENGTTLVGREMRFDTCRERGLIGEALTTFPDEGTNWFLRGNLAVDSTGKRLYAANSEFTSCDLPISDYHFTAGQVKWVSQSLMVARPAVLYVRDVPIVWIPFLFQETRQGRHSGILIPTFGFNDIVRPSGSYRRQVTNIGYYWAPNDYIDLTSRIDWFSGRYLQFGGSFRYRWNDRFVDGELGIDQQQQYSGGGSTNLHWTHNQDFSNTTSLRVNVNFVSNTSVLQENTVDPLLSTQQIYSQLTLNKRLSWGTTTLGGVRRQTLSDGSGTMSLPTLTVSPKPFALGEHFSWSPLFNIVNDIGFKQVAPSEFLVTPGRIDTMLVTGQTRSTKVNLTTPLRIGTFNWNNTISYEDNQREQRRSSTQRVPDLSTPEPFDSIAIATVTGGQFQSGLNWDTGINLPIVFQQSLKVSPTLGIANITTAGPFRLRNEATNGEWVQQGKKLMLGVTMSPSLFGFLNTPIGPVVRFRYNLMPLINVQYSPTATLSEEYARALSGSAGTVVPRETPATLMASVGLQQGFEGKLRPVAGDTNSDDKTWRKPLLLSIRTTAMAYDFEQAKLPGRSGWTTAALSNALQTDLIRGFSLTLTHDLWEGQVGTDSATFAPFLSNVQANMSFTGNTFHSIATLLGLAKKTDPRAPRDTTAPAAEYLANGSKRFRPGSFRNSDALAGLSGEGFSASLTYSLQRMRPNGTTVSSIPLDPFAVFPAPIPTVTANQSNIGLSMSFSPTRWWKVSWQTMYNATAHQFESQQLRLQRNLHDWTASFDFAKAASGNFALFFTIALKPLPDLKFDYNQTTLRAP